MITFRNILSFMSNYFNFIIRILIYYVTLIPTTVLHFEFYMTSDQYIYKCMNEGKLSIDNNNGIIKVYFQK